jgi:nucleotide-binding universal stress UspA family protein
MSTGGSAVVVGVDQAGQSSAALLWAAAEARRRDVALRIVHAWQPPSARPAPLAAPVPGAEVLERVTAILERVAPDLDVTVEPVQGSPGPVLVDAASEADLLVVGATETEGQGPLRYGSVSRHCVAHAACEVVVVPEPDPEAVG